jgi:hypothetical protein
MGHHLADAVKDPILVDTTFATAVYLPLRTVGIDTIHVLGTFNPAEKLWGHREVDNLTA